MIFSSVWTDDKLDYEIDRLYLLEMYHIQKVMGLKWMVGLILLLIVGEAYIVDSSRPKYVASLEFVVSDCKLNISSSSFQQVNLNEGAGGKYIYAFTTRTSNKYQAITRLDIVANSTPCVTGLTRSQENINEGAGGTALYFCTQRGGSNKVYKIYDIKIMAFDEPLDKPNMIFMDGWYFINRDLNAGTTRRGKYIYMFVQWTT